MDIDRFMYYYFCLCFLPVIAFALLRGLLYWIKAYYVWKDYRQGMNHLYMRGGRNPRRY